MYVFVDSGIYKQRQHLLGVDRVVGRKQENWMMADIVCGQSGPSAAPSLSMDTLMMSLEVRESGKCFVAVGTGEGLLPAVPSFVSAEIGRAGELPCTSRLIAHIGLLPTMCPGMDFDVVTLGVRFPTARVRTQVGLQTARPLLAHKAQALGVEVRVCLR